MAAETAQSLVQTLLPKFGNFLAQSTAAIQDSAPFYPADIRAAALEAHKFAHGFWSKFMAEHSDHSKEMGWSSQRVREVIEVIHHIDCVEVIIRERLASVRLIN